MITTNLKLKIYNITSIDLNHCCVIIQLEVDNLSCLGLLQGIHNNTSTRHISGQQTNSMLRRFRPEIALVQCNLGLHSSSKILVILLIANKIPPPLALKLNKYIGLGIDSFWELRGPGGSRSFFTFVVVSYGGELFSI